MLYQTMRPEFAPLLFVYGALAATFAMLLIYNLHTYQPLFYKKGLICFCTAFCACFILLFIRVTAPYQSAYNSLFAVSVSLAGAGMFAGLFSLFFYKREKHTIKAAPHINILNYTDDYAVIFAKDKELLFSTCPKELESKIHLREEASSYEFKHIGQHFQVSFSPVLDKASTIGYVGIISDITTEKNLLAELSEKIDNLNLINQELDKQVSVDDALLVARQQQRVSLEIQSEIEQKITELIKMIAQFENESSNINQIRNIEILAEHLRFILRDIRNIVYGRMA